MYASACWGLALPGPHRGCTPWSSLRDFRPSDRLICAADALAHARRPRVKANSAFHPSGIGKWVPASAGKAEAGIVHSISGWTRGVQVTLWDPLRTRAIPERLRGVFTTRRYTNPRLPYFTLPRIMRMGYYLCLNLVWIELNANRETKSTQL